MRYFLDCKVIVSGIILDLISLALLSEDGREYYCINWQCQFELANELTRKEDLSVLGKFGENDKCDIFYFHDSVKNFVRSRQQIAFDLLYFIKEELNVQDLPLFDRNNFSRLHDLKPGTGAFADKPRFWANFAAFKWVAFCQVFGDKNLPCGFPKYCSDLQQYAASLGDRDISTFDRGRYDAPSGAVDAFCAWFYLDMQDKNKN